VHAVGRPQAADRNPRILRVEKCLRDLASLVGNLLVARVDGHGMTLAMRDGDRRVVAFGEALE